MLNVLLYIIGILFGLTGLCLVACEIPTFIRNVRELCGRANDFLKRHEV